MDHRGDVFAEQAGVEVGFEGEIEFTRVALLDGLEHAVEIEHHPRVLLDDRPAHDHAVVDRIDVRLRIIPLRLGRLIEEIAHVRTRARIDEAAVDEVTRVDPVRKRIDFPIDEHLAEVLVLRHVLQVDPRRRREVGLSAVAHVGVAFHVPVFRARIDAVFGTQHRARPERGGLLELRHADLLAGEVGGFFDAAVGAHEHAGVKEAARGKDRQAHPVGFCLRRRDRQRRTRHLRNVELGIFELPVEHLRRMQRDRLELDRFGCDESIDDRLRARVRREGAGEFQFCHTFGALRAGGKKSSAGSAP